MSCGLEVWCAGLEAGENVETSLAIVLRDDDADMTCGTGSVKTGAWMKHRMPSNEVVEITRRTVDEESTRSSKGCAAMRELAASAVREAC